MIQRTSFLRSASLLALASLAAASFVACSDDSGDTTPVGTAGASGASGKGGSAGSSAGAGGSAAGSAGSTAGSAGTGGSEGGAAGEAGAAGAGGAPAPELARVRVAHLVSDGPAVAVCARVHGSDANAPYDLNVSKDLGGLANGLTFKQVSAYIQVPVGTYDLKIIDASKDCTDAGVASAELPALVSGDTVTVAARGTLAGTTAGDKLELVLLTDRAKPTADETQLRFVHAGVGAPAVDVGAYLGTAFAKVFPNTSYNDILPAAAPAAAFPIDDKGYATVAVDLAPTLSFDVRLADTGGIYQTVKLPDGVTVAKGALATVFAVGKLSVTNGVASGVSALACIDSAAPAGGLSTCVELVAAPAPAAAQIRLGHLLPGGPAVDVCAKPTTADAFLAGSSQRIGSGTYPSISASIGLAADSYDVKVVAKDAGCNAAAIVTAATGALATDAFVTAAVSADDTDATKPKVFLFANDAKAPAAGQSKLRLIHLGVGAPAIDAGVFVPGTKVVSPKLFTNAAYGTVAANVVDKKGYLEAAPLTNAVLAISGTGTEAALKKTAAGISTNADEIQTLFAIGKLGDATNPLAIFACGDEVETGGAVACVKVELLDPLASTPQRPPFHETPAALSAQGFCFPSRSLCRQNEQKHVRYRSRHERLTLRGPHDRSLSNGSPDSQSAGVHRAGARHAARSWAAHRGG